MRGCSADIHCFFFFNVNRNAAYRIDKLSERSKVNRYILVNLDFIVFLNRIYKSRRAAVVISGVDFFIATFCCAVFLRNIHINIAVSEERAEDNFFCLFVYRDKNYSVRTSAGSRTVFGVNTAKQNIEYVFAVDLLSSVVSPALEEFVKRVCVRNIAHCMKIEVFINNIIVSVVVIINAGVAVIRTFCGVVKVSNYAACRNYYGDDNANDNYF